ncbi:hypothetical protein J1N10_08465 [Carboxylicivirga sp. A043]|uniref:hypothetical protein n=1 Tax=Carboxylicivirga litoralis TaxID=2816963 RepID=UPI0021CAF85C|nr:hypothetical protein [Carboxylicivirga sp. A043]MCU4156008.1 hypothetical protein [Carboxylicivirga sp. A043]
MRKYNKPILSEVKIDTSTSLILMSTVLGGGNGQGGGWGPGGKPKGAAQVDNTQLTSNPFETNPFQ